MTADTEISSTNSAFPLPDPKLMVLNLPSDGNPNMKTKLCRHWKRGQCTFGSQCRFAHGAKELRGSAEVYKTSICRFWTLGACVAGSRCRHAHGQHELRTKAMLGEGDDCGDDCPPGLDMSPVHNNTSTFAPDSSTPSAVARSPSALTPPHYDGIVSEGPSPRKHLEDALHGNLSPRYGVGSCRGGDVHEQRGERRTQEEEREDGEETKEEEDSKESGGLKVKENTVCLVAEILKQPSSAPVHHASGSLFEAATPSYPLLEGDETLTPYNERQ